VNICSGIRVNPGCREIQDEWRYDKFDFHDPELVMMINQFWHPETTNLVDVLLLKPVVYSQFLPIKLFVLESFHGSCYICRENDAIRARPERGL